MPKSFYQLVLGNFITIAVIQILMNLYSQESRYSNAWAVLSFVAILSFIEWYGWYRKK
ncbi:hypothetical protein JK159_00755 [Weissella minor]|nr:hypothetical protein [Weissella minor]